MSRCQNCSFYWKNKDERNPSCKYESLGVWDKAPCEYDDEEENDNDYD